MVFCSHIDLTFQKNGLPHFIQASLSAQSGVCKATGNTSSTLAALPLPLAAWRSCPRWLERLHLQMTTIPWIIRYRKAFALYLCDPGVQRPCPSDLQCPTQWLTDQSFQKRVGCVLRPTLSTAHSLQPRIMSRVLRGCDCDWPEWPFNVVMTSNPLLLTFRTVIWPPKSPTNV